MRLTIIVPAYNVAPYLRDCLQSVLKDASRELCVRVIDDGSTDGSGDIARELAQADDRLSVISQPNGGVGAARNAGLAQAEADWIWFVDGDDMIADGAASALLNTLDDAEDVLCFRHQAGLGCTATDTSDARRAFSAAELSELRRQNVYRRADSPLSHIDCKSASFCVYRLAFLREHGLRFDPAIRKGQDTLFHFQALMCAQRVGDLDRALYLYRRNPGSISVRYVPDMPSRALELQAAYADAIQRFAPDDAALALRLELRRISMSRVCLFQDFCHADNPKPYAQRKADYLRYLRGKELQAAFTKLGELGVSPVQGLLYRIIKAGWFAPLDAMYRVYTKRWRTTT